MWIKKTDIEKSEEESLERIRENKTRFKKSLNIGLILFLFIAIFEPVASLTIGSTGGMNPNPDIRYVLRVDELLQYMPGFLRLAAIFGITFFLLSYFGLFKKRTSTLMCDKCHSTKNFDKNIKCECGGNFINLDNFKWIEDESTPDK